PCCRHRLVVGGDLRRDIVLADELEEFIARAWRVVPEHVPLPALFALVEHIADATMVEAGIGLAASRLGFPCGAHAQCAIGIDGPAAFTDGLLALFFRCSDEFTAVGDEAPAARIPFPGLVEI